MDQSAPIWDAIITGSSLACCELRCDRSAVLMHVRSWLWMHIGCRVSQGPEGRLWFTRGLCCGVQKPCMLGLSLLMVSFSGLLLWNAALYLTSFCEIENFRSVSGRIIFLTMRGGRFLNCAVSLLVTSLPCLVFIQNVFNKPKGTDLSPAVPLSQGQVVVKPPSGSAERARGSTASAASSVVPISVSGSAAASLQSLAIQSQQVALSHAVVKLRCQHCNHMFARKPELLFYKVKRSWKGLNIHVFSSSTFVFCFLTVSWFALKWKRIY